MNTTTYDPANYVITLTDRNGRSASITVRAHTEWSAVDTAKTLLAAGLNFPVTVAVTRL